MKPQHIRNIFVVDTWAIGSNVLMVLPEANRFRRGCQQFGESCPQARRWFTGGFAGSSDWYAV